MNILFTLVLSTAILISGPDGKKKKGDKKTETYAERVERIKAYGEDHGLPEHVVMRMVASESVRRLRQAHTDKAAEKNRKFFDSQRGKELTKDN